MDKADEVWKLNRVLKLKSFIALYVVPAPINVPFLLWDVCTVAIVWCCSGFRSSKVHPGDGMQYARSHDSIGPVLARINTRARLVMRKKDIPLPREKDSISNDEYTERHARSTFLAASREQERQERKTERAVARIEAKLS
eukprot:817936-Pleurochrysis_carterae.AAC.1